VKFFAPEGSRRRWRQVSHNYLNMSSNVHANGTLASSIELTCLKIHPPFTFIYFQKFLFNFILTMILVVVTRTVVIWVVVTQAAATFVVATLATETPFVAIVVVATLHLVF
jgi:hypothetical protein